MLRLKRLTWIRMKPLRNYSFKIPERETQGKRELKFCCYRWLDVFEMFHQISSISASTSTSVTKSIQFAWKIQGFNSMLIDHQKEYADAAIEVLPRQLIPDQTTTRTREISPGSKADHGVRRQVLQPRFYLFGEGSTASWIPCGRKLTCSYPKFGYGPDTYFGGHEV